jgi:type I restriction enzyme M protein
MPSKRDVLALLSRDELLAVVDRFNLSPPDRRAKDGLIDTIASSKRATLATVLPKLSLHRLKELCRILGVNESAWRKSALVERITGGRVKAETSGAPRARRAGKVTGRHVERAAERQGDRRRRRG